MKRSLRIFIKILKWVSEAAGILAALLIFLSLTVRLNSFRGEIEAAATDILHQPVHIKGNIRFSVLGWRPAVAMDDVVVRSNREKRPTTRADRVSVSLLALSTPQHFYTRIRGLTYEDYLLGDYEAPVRVYATGFDALGLTGKLDGASLSGGMSYLDNKFHVNLDLKNLPYQKIAGGMEGRVKGKILLDGRGTDIAQIVKTLEGDFTLTGGPGKLASKEINSWTRGLLSTIFSVQKDETKLNCTLADFKIKDGIATSRAIVVDTDEVAIFGKGNIDLNRQYVDITLKPKPKSASLVSVTTPVRLSGPMDNVDVNPVSGAVAKKIGGLLLGVVNPAMVLLPLVELGSAGDDNPCVRSVQQKSPAP
jgi:uncharacterized protein involved in outer membrane biogenesis